MVVPTKPRILFVDDSQLILDAMKRRLISIKSEWDIVFCSSGYEALELMGETPCLMVITDLKMPGMDGLELLNTVKERFPDTIRVILSGDSDSEAFLKTCDSVHQFLSKPCDTTIIKKVIVHAVHNFSLNNP
ncbi:MAG: response regulator [Fibrobacterales bacterium]